MVPKLGNKLAKSSEPGFDRASAALMDPGQLSDRDFCAEGVAELSVFIGCPCFAAIQKIGAVVCCGRVCGSAERLCGSKESTNDVRMVIWAGPWQWSAAEWILAVGKGLDDAQGFGGFHRSQSQAVLRIEETACAVENRLPAFRHSN